MKSPEAETKEAILEALRNAGLKVDGQMVEVAVPAHAGRNVVRQKLGKLWRRTDQIDLEEAI